MSKLNVDLMSPSGSGQGIAAQLLAQKFTDPGMLRPFIGVDGRAYISVYNGEGDRKDAKSYRKLSVNSATLRRDEWKHLDDAIIPVAESRLNGIQDLITRGLVYNLGNALGTTVLETHDLSDAFEAELSMDGIKRSKGDRPEYGTVYLPIPIIHVDYEINARVLEASRRLGNPLDTTSAERAARKVAEKLEKLLFTNEKYSFGGGTIYSYLNFPHRNTTTVAAWSNPATTAKNIIDSVRQMKQEALNANFYGPWQLYVPTTVETRLDDDYNTSGQSTQTIRERILKIAGIAGISVVDTLPDNNYLLVQMTSDVVRLVRGMGIQNVQWGSEGDFVTKYKVMTIQVPQIRSDHEGKCGVVHASV